MRAPRRRVRCQGTVLRAPAVILGLMLCIMGSALPAFAHTLPNSRWFWVQGPNGWGRVHLQILASRSHVTVYGSPAQVSGRDARSLAARFQSQIYPTDLRIFGAPSGMRAVNLVLSPLGGLALGYFNEYDVLPPASGLYSNHGNDLYIRPPGDMPDKNRMADVGEVAAHELQHLIDFRLRVVDHGYPREEPWLNEGLSFYAQLANRYFTQRDRLKVQAAAQSPGWRVTSMVDAGSDTLKHGRTAYGRAGLFATYLANRFGSGFIRDVLTDPRTGMTAIDDALRSRHESVTQVFADWGVASLLNQPGTYGYGPMSKVLRATPHLARPVITSLPYDSRNDVTHLDMAPWSHLYLRFGSRRGSTLVMTVQSPAAHLRVALVLDQRLDSSPDIVWLHPDAHGFITTSVPHFGSDVEDATIVAADTWGGPLPDKIRVKASLIEVPNNN